MNIQDLNGLDKDQLYKLGRSLVDKLDKRRVNLRKAYDKDPASVSTYGLQRLEEGIPRPTKKAHINTIKAQVLNLAKIADMKTTTVRGGKEQQTRMFRTVANVPLTGRLNKDQRQKVEYYRDQMRQNQALLSDYWTAYEHFRTLNEANFRYDPEKTLEAYRELYDQMSQNGAPSYTQLYNGVRAAVFQRNADINRQNQAMQLGRLRNQFIAPDEE